MKPDPTLRDIHHAIKTHWSKIIVFIIIVTVLFTIISQILYPINKLLPFMSVQGVDISGLSKADAITKLDKIYNDKNISIYFGDSKKSYISPKISEIGVVISNGERINKIDYPWYLRIVPSSILWAHFLVNLDSDPIYHRNETVLNSFISKQFGPSCDIKPQDASLKSNGSSLEVIPSHYGGTCEINIVKQMFSAIKPTLNENVLTIPFKEALIKVDNSSAKQLAINLENRAGDRVDLMVGGKTQSIPTAEIFGWMDFSAGDGKLIYGFNEERASTYLNKEVAPKVAIEPGVTTINTLDFTEVSRVEGVVGKKLDVSATLANLKSFFDGGLQKFEIAIADVSPKIEYSRRYSTTDDGISALIQQYAQSHSGVFGVSMVELSGQHRRASYNANKIFTPGSTYKLFVAYSSLLKVESGAWHMTDPIVDVRNLDECFYDMLVVSRNTCAEALILKLGRQQITNDAIALGCTQTSFLKNGELETSPADLAFYMGQLATGQLLSQQSSRDKIIDSLKRSPYRSGIPAGIKNSIVIDKIGVLWGLLNDVAIVYSPTGTYILAIMTDGSSWPVIADLANKIETIRNQ